MKKECLFVNVSRGGIVNTKDLLCSIQDGTISGVILDVFEEEPLPSDSSLWNGDRLMIFSHNSFEGERNMNRLESLITKNIMNEVCVHEKN